jgi:hypothetical protein
MQHLVSAIILSACQMGRCTVSDDIIVVKMELGSNFFCYTLIFKASILYCAHYLCSQPLNVNWDAPFKAFLILMHV